MQLQRLTDPNEASKYEKLTFPQYRPLLAQVAHPEVVAVGATHMGIPVGLTLARVCPEENRASLLSIVVLNYFQGKGAGATMLRQLDQELEPVDCPTLTITYNSEMNDSAALERLLAKSGWASPRIKWFLYKTTPERVSVADWMQEPLVLPEGCKIVYWPDLSEADKQRTVQLLKADPRYREAIPFRLEVDFEPCNSLVLFSEGEIAGWMLTNRVAPDTINYTNLFIRSDQRRMKRVTVSFSLVAEAMRRQAAAGIPYCLWYIAPYNRPMLKMAERYLAPYLLSSSLVIEAAKNLAPAATLLEAC